MLLLAFIVFFPDKLCSKQFLLRSLWKKVRQLEKSTPLPVVAVVTNMSYVCKEHLFVEFRFLLDFKLLWKIFTNQAKIHVIDVSIKHKSN